MYMLSYYKCYKCYIYLSDVKFITVLANISNEYLGQIICGQSELNLSYIGIKGLVTDISTYILN